MKLNGTPGPTLVLLTMVLTKTGAASFPVPQREAKGCSVAQFKSLSPRELQAFKRSKDALEEWLSLRHWHCSPHLFPRSRDLRQLQIWERPVALEAELALTLKILTTVEDPSLGAILEQPLHMLHHIHAELRACVLAQPTPGPRPRGRLRRWLQHLHKAQKKASRGCLEASVTFNLIRLLTQDLKCVASGDLCV